MTGAADRAMIRKLFSIGIFDIQIEVIEEFSGREELKDRVICALSPVEGQIIKIAMQIKDRASASAGYNRDKILHREL